MSDRDPLFEALANAWRGWDPMPADLPDRILTTIAMGDLDLDYEFLTLISRSNDLLGTRSGAEDRTLIEFQADGVSVLLRIVETEQRRHRLDGWVEPAGLLTVALIQGDRRWPATLASASRFEIDSLPHGLAQLEIGLTQDDTVRHFRSPTFEI